jgi:NDP-sugar pyrophosphorylase family protein
MTKTAIILCGGQGTRLRPYTFTIPKPLMPLGDRAILDLVIEQLAFHGFKRIVLAVNYRSDFIRAYFGSGEKLGVCLEYVEEDEPLGTIGPLKNIPNLPEKFLVMNGDILTNIDFSAFYDLFCPDESFALVPVHKKSYKVDFGVMGTSPEGFLHSFQEKPCQELLVSMGIYYFSPKVLNWIPKEGSFGFDQMMLCALEKNLPVSCPVSDSTWLDIGRPEDYAYAQDHYLGLMGSFGSKK